MGVPPVLIHFNRIFHEINYKPSIVEYPHDYGNPPFDITNVLGLSPLPPHARAGPPLGGGAPPNSPSWANKNGWVPEGKDVFKEKWWLEGKNWFETAKIMILSVNGLLYGNLTAKSCFVTPKVMGGSCTKPLVCRGRSVSSQSFKDHKGTYITDITVSSASLMFDLIWVSGNRKIKKSITEGAILRLCNKLSKYTIAILIIKKVSWYHYHSSWYLDILISLNESINIQPGFRKHDHCSTWENPLSSQLLSMTSSRPAPHGWSSLY